MALMSGNIQVTIGETKTLMGRGKNFMGGKCSHNGKTCLLRKVRSPSPFPPRPPAAVQLLHGCFLPYKTQSSFTKRTLLKVLG